MNKVKVTAATVMVALFGGTAWMYKRADGKELPQYRTAAVARASIKSTVSATGALSAVRTVQVGTQVSGQLAQIYVDFNDHVKKGQLLARIDPDAAATGGGRRAGAARAGAGAAHPSAARLRRATNSCSTRRSSRRRSSAPCSPTSRCSRRNVKSAHIALDRAQQNLSYTTIYAPIDGVIVERDVDVGQTVAASLSAPQLFLIANDLSQMQILASVDESDIGVIKDGQPVQFTVQSYPEQTFTGSGAAGAPPVEDAGQRGELHRRRERQERRAEAASGDDRDGCQFQTGAADNVLTVPNAALRLKPTEAMLAAARQNGQTGQAQNGQAAPRDSTRRASGTFTQDRVGPVAEAVGGASSVPPVRARARQRCGRSTPTARR